VHRHVDERAGGVLDGLEALVEHLGRLHGEGGAVAETVRGGGTLSTWSSAVVGGAGQGTLSLASSASGTTSPVSWCLANSFSTCRSSQRGGSERKERVLGEALAAGAEEVRVRRGEGW
jgi:hypothetical protein